MGALQTTIRTERLLLRRARESDLAALHAIMSDAEAMQFWSTPPHADLEATRQFLTQMIDAPAGISDDFIIEREGATIGKLGAWRLPEIGYLLSRSEWGKGYAFEALQGFIRHAFAGPLGYLTADVDPLNVRSLALLARAGFRETGRAQRTWNVGGKWADSVYLRLDREDRP